MPFFRAKLFQCLWKQSASKFGCYQSKSMSSTKNVPKNRMVYYSLSKNIYKNLALEEWIFENTDFSSTDVLLVWQSKPCVVIGRHQNPWIEADVPVLEEESVSLARRSSGGGTVYHDQGNLNLSFMKDRKRYNRTENLQLVVNALTSRWDLDLSINDRDDILLDGVYKVSGTAAKLTRNKSYHHFTLLHDVDQSKLSGMLSSTLVAGGDLGRENEAFVESRSSRSVPSSIQNLLSRAPSMRFEEMVESIAHQFLGQVPIACQTHAAIDPVEEQLFPGLSEICDRLQSWEWLYGKTPAFSIQLNTSDRIRQEGVFLATLCLTIEKGRLASFLITLNNATVIDLAYVANIKGIEIKRDNLRLFGNVDVLFGGSFRQAYPLLTVEDVRSIAGSVEECFPKMFGFL